MDTQVMVARVSRQEIEHDAPDRTDAKVTAVPPRAPAEVAERAMLARVLAELDGAGIPYWVIDGLGDASFDPCDVDVVVPREVLPLGLARVLHGAADRIGGDIVKWQEDDHVVLASRGTPEDVLPRFLNLHFRPDFRRVGRYFYSGEELLAGRRRNGAGGGTDDAWVPATPVEFGCYLIEKVAKLCLDGAKGRPLHEFYLRDSSGCEQQVRRFWGDRSAELIMTGVRSGDFTYVQAALPRLREELRRRAARRRPLWTAGYFLRKVWLKGVRKRWRPGGGMHIVLLGPDGVGKSTIQDAIRDRSRWSFSGVRARSFAPNPWRRPRGSPGLPHGKRTRSRAASLLKAAYWLVYYTIGYYFTVYPVKARSGLYVNHRYIVDALVDSKRYRYGGPQWILRFIWRVAPKPDLVMLLDAPAEVVQARKQEVPFEETARACAAYRQLVTSLPNGLIIDAMPPVNDVVNSVIRAVLRVRTARIVRRFGLEASAS